MPSAEGRLLSRCRIPAFAAVAAALAESLATPGRRPAEGLGAARCPTAGRADARADGGAASAAFGALSRPRLLDAVRG